MKYSTDSEFYREIKCTKNFHEMGFEYGAFKFLEQKYKKKLDQIEQGVSLRYLLGRTTSE